MIAQMLLLKPLAVFVKWPVGRRLLFSVHGVDVKKPPHNQPQEVVSIGGLLPLSMGLGYSLG